MAGLTHIAEDAVKRVVSDKAFVVKTNGGVLVRAVNRRIDFDSVLLTAAAATRYAFGPRILAIWFYDADAPVGSRWVDLMHLSNPRDRSLIDRNAHSATGVALFPTAGVNTGGILGSWDTPDFLYINFERPSGGIIPDIVTANTNVATIAAQYAANSGFVNHVTLVDGTISGSSTLGTGAASATVSGEAITWTAQPDWALRNLRHIITDADTPGLVGYWTRLSVSATLSATTTLTNIYAMAALVASATAKRGNLQAGVNYMFVLDDTVGGIEFIAQAGADTTVDIDWFDHRKTP